MHRLLKRFKYADCWNIANEHGLISSYSNDDLQKNVVIAKLIEIQNEKFIFLIVEILKFILNTY